MGYAQVSCAGAIARWALGVIGAARYAHGEPREGSNTWIFIICRELRLVRVGHAIGAIGIVDSDRWTAGNFHRTLRAIYVRDVAATSLQQ